MVSIQPVVGEKPMSSWACVCRLMARRARVAWVVSWRRERAAVGWEVVLVLVYESRRRGVVVVGGVGVGVDGWEVGPGVGGVGVDGWEVGLWLGC